MELYELSQTVELAMDIMAVEQVIQEAEVCASWCEQESVTLRYDPEEQDDTLFTTRSGETQGVSILVVIEDADGRKVGFGSDPELSREGLLQALEMAKNNAALEPLYTALPRPVATPPERLAVHDPEVLTLPTTDLITLAEEVLDGALTPCKEAGQTAVQIHGEVRSRKEIMLIANTHGLRAHETTTALHAAVRTCLPTLRSCGLSHSATSHLKDFSPAETGAEATRHALQGCNPIHLPSGEYPVILGPQAVAALFQELILPALCLDTIAAGASPFADRLGHMIASPLVTLHDDATLPGAIASHLITGDGLPTGPTPLITRGQLVGFLANAYHAQALDNRFGPLAPHNGMRFALDHQHFSMRPGIFPTNVLLTGYEAVSQADLLAPMEHGIYIGDLWLTTPQGSLLTGAFTSIVAGPSFHIQQGKLSRPLKAESLRLEADYVQLLQQITGISSAQQAVPFASQQSVMFAPEVRCEALTLIVLEGQDDMQVP